MAGKSTKKYFFFIKMGYAHFKKKNILLMFCDVLKVLATEETEGEHFLATEPILSMILRYVRTCLYFLTYL